MAALPAHRPGLLGALTLSAWWLGTRGVFTSDGLWTYYGFAQTYREFTIPGGLTQAWTLCIEVTFYAFLPLWAWAMRRAAGSLRGEAIALAALAAASLAYKLVVLGLGSQSQIRVTPALIALPAYLDQFALGMASRCSPCGSRDGPSRGPSAGCATRGSSRWPRSCS